MCLLLNWISLSFSKLLEIQRKLIARRPSLAVGSIHLDGRIMVSVSPKEYNRHDDANEDLYLFIHSFLSDCFNTLYLFGHGRSILPHISRVMFVMKTKLTVHIWKPPLLHTHHIDFNEIFVRDRFFWIQVIFQIHTHSGRWYRFQTSWTEIFEYTYIFVGFDHDLPCFIGSWSDIRISEYEVRECEIWRRLCRYSEQIIEWNWPSYCLGTAYP